MTMATTSRDRTPCSKWRLDTKDDDDSATRARARADAIARAEDLLDRFNAAPRRSPHGPAILKELLGAVGDNVVVRKPFYCDIGSNIHLSDSAFLNFDCVLLDDGEIRIGARTVVDPGVHIYTVTPQCATPKPVVIEDDVNIGGKTVIMPGVTIGRGAIIAPGSVVTKDVPPRTLYSGSPATIVQNVEQEDLISAAVL